VENGKKRTIELRARGTDSFVIFSYALWYESVMIGAGPVGTWVQGSRCVFFLPKLVSKPWCWFADSLCVAVACETCRLETRADLG